MKRRSFIKQTGLLTGGLLLQQQMAAAFSLGGATEKINVGIIGCGDRGKGIMHVLNEFPDKFSITAICDVLDFRLKEAQDIKVPDVLRTYKDHRKLLEEKNLQAVIIATPLNLHYPIAVDALAAGKHVYLEKTMTYNVTETQNLVLVAKENPKLTLQVGHQYRYTPLYYQVKKMIENDFLGKVTQIDCRWDRNWNWKREVKDPSLERKINWRMYREYSGGLPAELLSHQLDFVNWAFNTHPDEIMATGGVDFYKDGRETFDNVQAILRYAKQGMIGNFGATCANAKDGYLFKLKGSKGSISLSMDKGIFYP
jgi:predicted dehydrogenase